MGVKIREKRGYLYLDVYWNGQRHWEALHLSVGDAIRKPYTVFMSTQLSIINQ